MSVSDVGVFGGMGFGLMSLFWTVTILSFRISHCLVVFTKACITCWS